MKMFTNLLALCLSLIWSSSAFSGVIQLFDRNGKLIGANNVKVQIDGRDHLYDVLFKDGFCGNFYIQDIACDENVFPFRTAENANKASQALLDQVLTGEPDLNPAFTEGCFGGFCDAYTPFATDAYGVKSFPVMTSVARNLPEIFGIDSVHVEQFSSGVDTGTWINKVWVVWTHLGELPTIPTVPNVGDPTEVPEPPTIWMFAMAVAMVLSRKCSHAIAFLFKVRTPLEG